MAVMFSTAFSEIRLRKHSQYKWQCSKHNLQCADSNVLLLWHQFKIHLQHVYSSLCGQYGHFWHNRRNTFVPVSHV